MVQLPLNFMYCKILVLFCFYSFLIYIIIPLIFHVQTITIVCTRNNNFPNTSKGSSLFFLQLFQVIRIINKCHWTCHAGLQGKPSSTSKIPRQCVNGVLTRDKSLSIPELELTALLSGYQSPQLTFMQSQCIYEEEVHDPKHYLFYFKHQCASILWIIQDILNFNVWLRSGSKIMMFKIQTEAVLEGIVKGRDNLWINECITKDFIIILFLCILITRIW